MDPPLPFDHPHHRRSHHYPDQHHHFAGVGGGAAPVRSRYEYDSYEPLPAQYHHLPSDHHHHHHQPPRVHHQQLPPPPPLPLHRHEATHYAPPPPAPPEAYSTPPYHDPAPHYHNYQRHGDGDLRPVDELRRVASHHHHHHHPQQQQQQLPWEEAGDDRRRYATPHQLRLSPSGSRKRQRCAMHDYGELESTSSSGPPPRHPRQQPHPNYAPADNFVDRTATHPGYISHEGTSMHSDSKGNRKMQIPSQVALPGSPHATGAGYPRRTPQKSAPSRVSVWQRIEENPTTYAPSSPRQLPKDVHISPSKSNNAGSTSKELASLISVDCKGKSAVSNDSDSDIGMKTNAGKKNGKVLASVLVKPPPESKDKEGTVKKVTRKPDNAQKNVVGSTSKSVGLTAFPRAGVKKVKKIIIKKIVRKIGGKDKQTSSSVVSEMRDSIDANANACEREEGEILTSSFEKDVVSSHNLVSTSSRAGDGNGVDVQKEENNKLTNPSKRNAASAIELFKILDPTCVSGSERLGKEEDRSSMDPGDCNAASAIESTELLDTIGSEHSGKEDWISMDSGATNASFVFENDNSQEEGKILPLSGEMSVAVASNSVRFSDGCKDSSMERSNVPKDMSENNAVYLDGVTVNHDTSEVSGSEDARRKDSKILIGTNEDGVFLVNNVTVGPSTTEVSVCEREGAQKKDSMIPIGSGGRSIASLGKTVGTSRTTEVGVRQDAQEEEGNMLNHPSEKDFVSVSWGTLNTIEVSVNEDIQEKEGRMPMESSEANTSVTHHAKASNTVELNVNEDTQKKESQMPIESFSTNTFETIDYLEAPNTAEVIISKFVGREVGKNLVGSNERHAGTTDKSVNTPKFDVSGAEDSCMEVLLNDGSAINETDAPLEVEDTDFFNQPSSRNVGSTNVPPLDDYPMEDATSDIILNDCVGRNTTTQAADLIHLHGAHLSPENDFTLVRSRESPSSANSEQSVRTALTLGCNIYFSNAESEGQPEENHELVEGQQGYVTAVTEFDSLGKTKGVAGDDLISAGVQNWLTLPLAVNNFEMSGQLLNNNATISKDSLGLDQSVDDGTSVSQDHDITQGMDQRGSVDAFFSQDHNIRLCGSDMPQSDLLTPKEISGDVTNQSGIVLYGLNTISSINVLDQYGYQMVDSPVDNPIKPVLSALESSQSTDVMDAELASSQVSVDPDHTYHNNAEDPVVESSTRQDLLSSWIEAIVSEAKKEHQQCKSTQQSISSPEKSFAPKEDSLGAVPDALVNSVLKSPGVNLTSSMLPKVAPKQVNLPSSSRELPRSSQNARHKTWHRGNMASSTSSLHVSQPSGLPPKQPLRKNGKTQNSYIRKGNALIRNPATGNHPLSSSSQDSSLDTQNKLNKPVMRRSMNFVRKIDSNDFVPHSNISVERPKTPPLPLHTKSISCTTNLPEQLSQTSHEQHGPETEKEDAIGQLNSGVDNPSIIIAQKSEHSDANKVVYVRPKSNQLVAAQGQHPGDSINSSMDKVLSLQPSTTSDFYLKKRKNQIILSSAPSDGQNTKDMTSAESLNSDENKGVLIASSNNGITGVKDRPHKALQTTNNMGSFSHVWTLSGQQPHRKGTVWTSYMKVFPRILPWKRKIYYKNFRSSHTSLLNMGSLRIVRKLLQTKKRDMIYTVSTDGFSIRKSAVLSVGGSSLKWSRSLEKRTQKVNEEATLAVADVERKKREKRKRQSPRDKGRNDSADQDYVHVAGNQLRKNNQSSSDLSRPSTSNEYVRVSKGNQLVRNPKKVICMLASEKVRWSLHTVRSRLAKKQQYCQFFTRFGECKKPGGKCPYIHDRAKVAICTKFLKGLCSNTSCKLTHKVLPERMEDCSYFLRGLCTNTACPYRHVKVNSNAPVCEDFLKGYCADGDECHKKHSYVCPVFEATGECPQQSRCKLHHPKKKIKTKSSRPDVLQNSGWGRYFDTSIGHDSETRKVSSDGEERQRPEHVFSGEDFVDFISLGADAEEGVAEVNASEEGVTEVDASDGIQLMELDSGDLNVQADNLDALIKPLRIMRTARV